MKMSAGGGRRSERSWGARCQQGCSADQLEPVTLLTLARRALAEDGRGEVTVERASRVVVSSSSRHSRPMRASMAALDLILLGTATSSGLPAVQCLTDPVGGCHCCRSTLDKADLAAQKNLRRNTSAILRVPPRQAGDRERTILIDVRPLPSSQRGCARTAADSRLASHSAARRSTVAQ